MPEATLVKAITAFQVYSLFVLAYPTNILTCVAHGFREQALLGGGEPLVASPFAFTALPPKQKHSRGKSRQLCPISYCLTLYARKQYETTQLYRHQHKPQKEQNKEKLTLNWNNIILLLLSPRNTTKSLLYIEQVHFNLTITERTCN